VIGREYIYDLARKKIEAPRHPYAFTDER